jgi:mannose-6-phosphate isomerase class I
LRPLHLEQAYSVMRYDADPTPTAHLGDAACTPLLATEHYSIASWDLQPDKRTWQFDKTSPTVVFALEGEATVGGCSIVRGQTAVVPACITEVTASGRGTVIVARA